MTKKNQENKPVLTRTKRVRIREYCENAPKLRTIFCEEFLKKTSVSLDILRRMC